MSHWQADLRPEDDGLESNDSSSSINSSERVDDDVTMDVLRALVAAEGVAAAALDSLQAAGIDDALAERVDDVLGGEFVTAEDLVCGPSGHFKRMYFLIGSNLI